MTCKRHVCPLENECSGETIDFLLPLARVRQEVEEKLDKTAPLDSIAESIHFYRKALVEILAIIDKELEGEVITEIDRDRTGHVITKILPGEPYGNL
jgi:hypothetical protein